MPTAENLSGASHDLIERAVRNISFAVRGAEGSPLKHRAAHREAAIQSGIEQIAALTPPPIQADLVETLLVLAKEIEHRAYYSHAYRTLTEAANAITTLTNALGEIAGCHDDWDETALARVRQIAFEALTATKPQSPHEQG